MPSLLQRSSGPLRITTDASERVALRPATAARITAGLWAERQRVNREVSVPQAWDRLHEAGNIHDLELAAGRADGDYVNGLPFMDSDVHKWLEAVGWTLADADLTDDAAAHLRGLVDQTEDLLRAAQEPDGYLDSHFQVRYPGERFAQLAWGHELYCAGHLIQAAVAVHRSAGDDRVLDIARRVADLVVDSFGIEEGKVDGVCGHPEIETALVELYRETNHKPYLDKARYFVDRRGHGLVGDGHFGRHYWQDHTPIREAQSVEGHAVRQLYLLAGVADLVIEEGDTTLLAACERLWAEMVATKTYITGGIGAHHKDEAFGDPYELPNERSYCETCAAIASIQLAWRMLMITGEAKYGALLERTLYNGFLAGLSLDGQRYIYANPLQVREGHLIRGDDGDYERRPWFHCACCPPNVMRLIASLQHYVVLAGKHQLAVHQYVPGDYTVDLDDGPATISIDTQYPWNGSITVRVTSSPIRAWTLRLRIPEWSETASVSVNGETIDPQAADGWLDIEREWTADDQVTLELEMTPRFTTADPRVDSARGAVALEYGPLVYCIESLDNPNLRLDDLRIDTNHPARLGTDAAGLDGIPRLQAHASTASSTRESWWPYRNAGVASTAESDTTEITAVPYFAWGNRGHAAMRIWIPSS